MGSLLIWTILHLAPGALPLTSRSLFIPVWRCFWSVGCCSSAWGVSSRSSGCAIHGSAAAASGPAGAGGDLRRDWPALTDKRLLQAAVALGCIVPLSGGTLGILFGAGMLDHGGDSTLDSHARYLSGLLLAVGLGFASTIPAIERHGARVTLLSLIVVVGGLARFYGVLVDGWPAPTMIFALGMELGVVPLLLCWQRRISNPSIQNRAELSLSRLEL